MFTLHLSSKQTVVIDEDDFKKFAEVAPTGNLIRLKQAVVNPAFVVAIVPTKEEPQKRLEGHIDENTGAFVVTGEKYIVPEIRDEFSEELRLR